MSLLYNSPLPWRTCAQGHNATCMLTQLLLHMHMYACFSIFTNAS